MMNKNYADLRVKLGTKKLQNERGFGNLQSGQVDNNKLAFNDMDSIPSDLAQN